MKIYYNGELLRDRRGRFTSYLHRFRMFIRDVLRYIGMGIVGTCVMFLCASLFLTKWEQWGFKDVYYASAPPVFADEKEELPPVLIRIAKCESGNKHYNADGTLVRGKIVPTDLGRFQISAPHWEKKARELGWDIHSPYGNEQMAVWIYENYGTEPWSASKKCWR